MIKTKSFDFMNKQIVSRLLSVNLVYACLIVIISFITHTLFLSEDLVASPQTETLKQFKAGAATSNITPPLGTSLNGGMQDRKAQHVHDELHARAVALDDGQNQLAIVVVDNCLIPREIYDEAKRRVNKWTGLPVENMLMSATHTHSAGSVTHVFQSLSDAGYAEFLTVRIADAIVRAINNLEPARIGWGSGEVPDQVYNRRWYVRSEENRINPFGGIDSVRMNPPRDLSELIEPAGPTDPELSIISVQALDGRPISLLANYSLHYVGGVGSGHISADYFGAFAQIIKGKVESQYSSLPADSRYPPFVGMMSNGTSGDINNVNFTEPAESRQPYEQIQKVAEEVAAEAFRVYQELEYNDWVPLQAQVSELELGVRLPDHADLQRAQKIVQQAAGPAMQSREEIYARETLFLSEYPSTVPLIVQAIRIGDLAITAIPCEVFVEIGLELKQLSPFDDTFTISLANGYNGYLPTVKHHELGGYETWRAKSSYLEIRAAPKVVDQLSRLLQQLKQNN